MLNSTAHEIPIAHIESKMLKNNDFFCLKHYDGVFILLINVKMPTVVGEQDKFRTHLN